GPRARRFMRPRRDARRVPARLAPGVDARLARQDHYAVGLLAARAARGPHVDGPGAALAPRHQRLGQDLRHERAQLAALAEEVGLIGRELVDQRGELAVTPRLVAQLETRGRQAVDPQLAHAAGAAAPPGENRIA